MIQSSWTLSEAMTKKGRCSEASGNGPLILGACFGKRTLDFAQLIELLEGRGVATDASTTDCLRRESYYAVVNGYKAP